MEKYGFDQTGAVLAGPPQPVFKIFMTYKKEQNIVLTAAPSTLGKYETKNLFRPFGVHLILINEEKNSYFAQIYLFIFLIHGVWSSKTCVHLSIN